MGETTVYLLERTLSDDELNIFICRYATLDGTGIYRVERSMTGIQGGDIPCPPTREVDSDDLIDVVDPESVEEYQRRARAVKADVTATGEESES